MTNKEFVQNHVPWDFLRKTAPYKGLNFNDYDEITKRFLSFFGYERPEQYVNMLPEMFSQSFGRFPDTIDYEGNIKGGGGFHLSLTDVDCDVVCGICECKQVMSIPNRYTSCVRKCKGCKQKIKITTSK